MLGIIRQRAAAKLNHASGLEQGIRAVASRVFSSSGKEMAVRDALNSALDEEMFADPKVFVMVEKVDEYQGAYKITKGLLDGPERVHIHLLLKLVGFAGIGVGAAYHGLRPVIEFMNFNFSMQAIDHIINSAAKSNYMSAGQISVPIVFRGPNGAAAGVGAQHSQCYAAWFAACPELKVLAPYSAEDARGLLKEALRDPDPVVFLENELLYGESFPLSAEALDSSLCLPIGKAKAADILAKEGIIAEVINLRSNASVKPKRLVTAEGVPQHGVGAEICASVVEDCFKYLDARIEKFAGADVPMPCAANLERMASPQIFLLGKGLVFVPDGVFLSVILIVAPATIFCVFVARKLMDKLPGHRGTAIMVEFIVFTVYVLVLLLLTSSMDPGVIPRNAQPPEPENYENSLEFVSGQTPRLPRTRDVIVNGIVVEVKYCDTCMLYRPPRCSHCSICDNCVERSDHHCSRLGNCIGLKLSLLFCMFVFSTTLLSLYVHRFCWVYIKKIMDSEHISRWKAMTKTPASIALIIYTSLSSFYLGVFSMYHLYIISINQTSRENDKDDDCRGASPYNRGTIQNCMEIFCTGIPPSKNKFWAKVLRKPEMPSQPISAGSNMGVDKGEQEKITGGNRQ